MTLDDDCELMLFPKKNLLDIIMSEKLQEYYVLYER